MYLLTKLNKRAKTISWFLIHVFVLQIIPFSSFAGSNNEVVSDLINNHMTFRKVNVAKTILAWSESGSKAKDSQISVESSDALEQTSENLQLKSVSSAGGGFSPGSMNDMVDPFTGDFSYSIPLMDVEGYPLTLSYNSNVTMSSEATWVGLGWNLDVGSVSREMRGIPDDFNGDQYITSTYKVKKDETNDGFKAGGYMAVSTGFGAGGIGVSAKVQLTALWGRYTNSYLGLGKTFDIGLQAAANLSFSMGYLGEIGPGLKFGLGYSSDTKGGVGFNKSFGLTLDYGPKNGKTGLYASVGTTFGNNFNSRHGLIAKTGSFNVSAGYVTSAAVSDFRTANGNLLARNGHSGTASGAAYGASSSIPYGTAASIPRLRRTTSSKSDAFMTDLYFGFRLKPVTIKIGAILETYTTSTELSGSTSVINQPAYGYLHSGKRAGENESFSVMDFDRGTDFAFSENMRNLPFSIQAFDIFHVSSSGLNAQFRANRSDVGTYFDASVQGELNHDSELLINDDMKAVNAGVLLGAGITIEAGYSTAVNRGETESGKWYSGVNFNSVAAGSKFDPDTYFKAVGELTPNDLTNYNTFGGENASYFPITKSGTELNLSQTLDNGTSISQGSIVNIQPERATVFEPITVSDLMASQYTYDQNIHYFTPTGTSAMPELRNTGRANNHISAIKVVSASGGIYNYGLPNYSLFTSDVSFSISDTGGRIYDDSRGEVSYVSGDDETSNTQGKAHMLDRTDIPAYASSFMLTSIVGSDYVDMTNDGPTIDDVGGYHKFDYVRYYDSNNRYKWRFPVSGMSGGKPKAILNKGYLSLSSDDNATYSYSEREVYYPKSISGKNYIAVFVLEERKDAYAVSGKDGFLDTDKPLHCLDKIILYNLSEYNQNPNTATKLQVIDFEYGYSLCLNAPNNPKTYSSPGSPESGKLTLRSIRSYSGTSEEMGRSQTVFTYNDGPGYNHLNVDRWGNYKENNPNLPNNLYPAAIQNETIANENAKFWKLSTVTTPTGGEMQISYEADSYGFVQNKRAMRHFQIAGMMNLYQCRAIMNGEAWNTSNLSNEFRNDSYDPNLLLINQNFFKKYGTLEKNLTPNNMIIFKLERPIDGAVDKNTADKTVKDDYFKDPSKGSNAYLKELYFNVYAQVKPGYQEMIPCFVQIMEDYQNLFYPFNGSAGSNMRSIGVMPPTGASTSYEYGYVMLDPINVGMLVTTQKKKKKKSEKEDILIMNPIQRFGVDFIRQNLPDIVYGACETCSGELAVDKKALFGEEMYKYLITEGSYLRSMDLSRSFVRLYEPDNKKMGGNARVAGILLNDKWGDLSGEGIVSDGTYGWQYLYPNRSSSLGVAAYEPASGMDENPFYEWDTYYNIARKFPDEMNFNVTPVAMQLYPSPIVGYEQVRVQMTGASQGAKGSVIYNFHTNKEFEYRTQAKTTGVDLSDPVQERAFFSGSTLDKYGFSQGYSVITNDFHGKPIDVTLVDTKGNPISKSEYEYYKLGENIPMIDRQGIVKNENAAREVDVHMDSRFVYTESKFQMAGLTLGFTFPTFKVSIGPSYSQSTSKRGFYSHSLIKHINYSAIVKSITTSYLGSSNTAKNELYDKYSGEVIVSSLQDEYNDRLYNLAYPSHWYYPGLREIKGVPAGIISGDMNAATGQITTEDNMAEFYAPGDLVILNNGSSNEEGIILSIAEDGLSAYVLKDNGAPFAAFSGMVSMTLKKSNRSNRLTESMQSIVTKEPITVELGNFSFPSNGDILSSSALIYKDKNNLICSGNGPVNPFTNGAKGELVVDGEFSWQSERKHETNSHGTRFDGAYSSYEPFYSMEPGREWRRLTPANYQGWRKSGEVTKYNHLGNPIEGKDPLRIFSSMLYVNNNRVTGLPVAQVVNASLTDVAYDGFEEYTYGPNAQTGHLSHFDFVNQVDGNAVLISNTVRHSGKSSIQLQPGARAVVDKTLRSICPSDSGINTDIPQNLVISPDNNCLCTPPFNPLPGRYLCNAWVKTNGNATVQIEITKGSPPMTSTVDCQPVGPVIEGWQRVELEFDIPGDISIFKVRLQNSSGQAAYFDDLRIHPFLAGMSTTVYDPLTFLPLATHDGYNYTTFYNYDENLQLVRVKVETIEGIKTVSETESGLTTK